MSSKKTILTGTLILTVSGILTRLLGFYYKIFLSNAIGLTAFGLYQMVLPAASVCLAICCGGIQTSLQKNIAENDTAGRHEKVYGFVRTALVITIIPAVILSVLLYFASGFIAARFFGNDSLAPLLQIIALSLVPSCIHSCINAYFLGCSKTGVPSAAQLLEQCVRVGSVVFLISLQSASGSTPTAATGLFGVLFGEIASSLFCATFYLCRKGRIHADSRNTFSPLLSMTLPLTADHVLLHLFQSLEAVLIPTCLCLYGNTYNDAVSIYGMITGMAMSLVMLPSTLVHSFAVMLLPEVSAAQSQKNEDRLVHTTQLSLVCCMYIGILCTAEFLVFGREAGMLLFGDERVGVYVQILSWLCPLMYLASTFSSILNGLGKTGLTFALNMGCTLVRIFAVWILGPRYGIYGVLIAFLAGQLLAAAIFSFAIHRYIPLSFHAVRLIVIPSVCAFFASAVARLIYKSLQAPEFFRLCLAGIVLAGIYGGCVWWLEGKGE